MKSRIFIGSSIEGLSVAYSIQQNLTHDAEVTVWDQGVFELSKTTIESLTSALEKSDFGIFVFNNDDIIRIRDIKKNTVRDNVLFEFGLFIGKLSRERVYFVIPSETELHLPTDLLGITPGKYDSKREDGSLQAALGPVSNQIKLLIKKLGRVNSDDGIPNSSENTVENLNEEKAWYQDFADKKYKEAKNKLEAINKKEKEKDAILQNKIWIAYCDFKINEVEGIKQFESILKNNSTNIISYRGIARIYLWEEYLDNAYNILKIARATFGNEPHLILLESDYYKKAEGVDKALEFLGEHEPEKNIDVALERVNILVNKKDYLNAKNQIHSVYLNFPNNEKVRFAYGKIAIELRENEIALFLLKSLTSEFDSNAEYWGYLSNCALQLNFYDLALSCSKKAEEISGSKQQWIISNIGNIFNNKGFHSEAIKYLEKGLKLNSDDEYAHDRLASAIKLRDEEKLKVESSFNAGRRSIRDYNKKVMESKID